MNNKVQLSLQENLSQFILLVIVNAFVGDMVGLERSILPKIAEEEFHIAATSAVLSYIIVFGIAKAFTNYFTGRLTNKFGRKNYWWPDWLLAFILLWANKCQWIITANILSGIHLWQNTFRKFG